jgi:hypothetical protein
VTAASPMGARPAAHTCRSHRRGSSVDGCAGRTVLQVGRAQQAGTALDHDMAPLPVRRQRSGQPGTPVSAPDRHRRWRRRRAHQHGTHSSITSHKPRLVGGAAEAGPSVRQPTMTAVRTATPALWPRRRMRVARLRRPGRTARARSPARGRTGDDLEVMERRRGQAEHERERPHADVTAVSGGPLQSLHRSNSVVEDPERDPRLSAALADVIRPGVERAVDGPDESSPWTRELATHQLLSLGREDAGSRVTPHRTVPQADRPPNASSSARSRPCAQRSSGRTRGRPAGRPRPVERRRARQRHRRG